MKKMITIILIILNLFVFKSVEKVSIEKIDLSLNKDELGIVFLNLENSNSLLLSLNNINILYVLNYINSDDIYENLSTFSINVDYVIMNSDYNIEIGEKKVFHDYLHLNNIVFNNRDYIMINYADKTLCINPTLNNCDYVYYTYNVDFYISNNNKIFFYNEKISTKYLNEIYNKWVDSYKISNDLYTIIKIKDNYEVLEIPKNI